MKMKKYIIIILSMLTLFVSSCSSDYSLEKSVFIEDVTTPGLPIYSEWGYNTFGAYIDREKFISEDSQLPAKIIVNADTMNLTLKGIMGYGNVVSLKFSIKGFSPADYTDLIMLNDTTINLKDSKCIVTLKTDMATNVLKIIEGTIRFKRVQNLYVDKELNKAILSGYFSFKTFLKGEPIAVSNGRFDLGIGYDNFYNY
jgi:hypothetical protein